jgi:hypothetical protein
MITAMNTRKHPAPGDGLPTRQRVAKLIRDVRERMHIEPVAYSADGRLFSYEAPLSADVQVGGWVRLGTPGGRRYLGQVVTEEVTVHEGPLVNLDLGATPRSGKGDGLVSQAGFRVRARRTGGVGTILARESGRHLVASGTRDTFDDASIEAADGGTVARYLDATAGKRARLDVGVVQRCSDGPSAHIRADGFDRHTLFCGQSGSGKTYALGVVLEQLILHTDLHLIILDPNSDFVRIREVRSSAAPSRARAYRQRARRLSVLRPPTTGVRKRDALLARFSDLAEREQAAVLRLDPLADREEYAALATIGESLGTSKYSLDDVLRLARRSDDAVARELALRIQNLGAADWAVWARGNERTSAERLAEDTRGIVLDIGSLSSKAEKSAVAANVLGGLWQRRARRRPTLVVIDEAHNVCPGEPGSALQANATEYCINIAAEGRKFGLYLLLATQRPQKIHPNVLSQCDNLVLMRMNSRADLAELAAAFSFVPPTLLEESMRFTQGEALLAGKVVPAPLIARIGGRVSEEGGADIAPTWADARS